MVYETFKEQLPHFPIASVKTPTKIDTVRLFKFFIAIHDIGKPIAIAKEGKHAQHKYTSPIVKRVMRKEGFSKAEIKLTKNIINNDILGAVVKGLTRAEDALPAIKELADSSSMSLSDYFLLQSFFYTVDAASYPILRQRIFHEENGMLVPNSQNFHDLAALAQSN